MFDHLDLIRALLGILRELLGMLRDRRRGLYDGVRGLCGPGNGSPHDNPGAISRAGVFCRIKPNIAGDAARG